MRLLMAPKDKITRDFLQGVQRAFHVNMGEPAHKDVAQRRARNMQGTVTLVSVGDLGGFVG